MIDELYKKKGLVITQIEELQAMLHAINQELLSHRNEERKQSVDKGSSLNTNGLADVHE